MPKPFYVVKNDIDHHKNVIQNLVLLIVHGANGKSGANVSRIMMVIGIELQPVTKKLKKKILMGQEKELSKIGQGNNYGNILSQRQ